MNCLRVASVFISLTAISFCSSVVAFQQEVGPVFPKNFQRAIGSSSRSSASSMRRRNSSETTPYRSAKSILVRNQPRLRSDAPPIKLATPAPGSNENSINYSDSVANESSARRQPESTPDRNESATDGDDSFGTVMTFPVSEKNCAEPEVVIHPPSSTSVNEFAFIVENIGSARAGRFTVEISTPADVSILRVFPFHAAKTTHSATVQFEGLDVHEQSPIHIKTSPGPTESFRFETVVRKEKASSFEVPFAEWTDEDQLADQNHSRQFENPYQLASSPKNYRSDTHAGARNSVQSLLADDAEDAGETEKTFEDSSSDLPVSILQDNVTSEFILTTAISGPQVLIPGQSSDFEIRIVNHSSRVAHEVVVQLILPLGLMINNLDRQAWVDQKSRAVSWKVASIGGNQSEIIRYRVQAIGQGDQLQKVALGMDNILQGHVEFKSTITGNLRIDDAPRLAPEE